MGRLGYWRGVRQPALQIHLRAPHQIEVNFPILDNWLASVLGMTVENEPRPVPGSASNAKMSSWAWRVLQVAAYLQQEARIPVFGSGRIMQLAADPNKPDLWIINALVPCLDLLAKQVTLIAYEKAAKLIEMAVDSQYDKTNTAEITENIEKVAIKPLRLLSMSGASTVPILKEAFLQNIPYRHLGAGVYQLGWAKNSRMLDRSVVDTDSSIGSKIANKKHWTAQFLRSAGLPAPVHALVNTEAEAKRAAQQLGWPLVVKPADRERSEGVTISIRDDNRLLQGFKLAARLSKLILVEREIPGICYRLMVANGDFLYAVRRHPKAVFGDGRATIAQLIERASAENEMLPSWRRAKYISHDELCAEALVEQGRKIDDVPHPEERVALRLIESIEWGGDVEDATADVHPDNRDIAVRSARLFGLSNAGIDIITPDISKPWHKNGAIINEVNFAPQFGATLAARSRMALYLAGLLQGDGRIPIEVFIGADAALSAARRRQRELAATGLHHHITTHERTWASNDKELKFDSSGLFDRCLALLMDREVQGLILVVQNDELLRSGLPIDRVDRVHVDYSNTGVNSMNPAMRERLSTVLAAHSRQPLNAAAPHDGN